jgi:hypothetical protein
MIFLTSTKKDVEKLNFSYLACARFIYPFPQYESMAHTVKGFLKEIRNTTKQVKSNTSEFMYHISLLLLLMTHFVAIFLLLPVFLFLKGMELYIVLVLFSVFMGIIFNYLLHEFHHVGEKHHVIISILVPTMALFDMVLLIRALDKLDVLFNLHLNYNPVAIVLVFVVVFLAPYAVDLALGKHVISF